MDVSLSRFRCLGMSPILFSFFWSASLCPQAILSSSKDSNSHKDDGLFKAPPPPPKVIKSETIPTRLNQDIVTALKCRKEHKEVSRDKFHSLLQHLCKRRQNFILFVSTFLIGLPPARGGAESLRFMRLLSPPPRTAEGLNSFDACQTRRLLI